LALGVNAHLFATATTAQALLAVRSISGQSRFGIVSRHGGADPIDHGRLVNPS
jgi:hypothetical protein